MSADPSAPAIIEGRLHPASIALGLLSALKRSAIWLVIFAIQSFTADSMRGVVVGVISMGLIGVFSLIGPVIVWLRYRYRLTRDELAIDSGLVRRQQRRIPVSRIQDLSFQTGPVHRLLGVVVVAVQTSGTEGAEAKLDAITKEQGEALRRALRSLSGRVPEQHDVAEAPPIVKVSTAALVVRGLTDNRAGLILAGLLGFIAEAIPDDDVSFFASAWETGQSLLAPIIGRGAIAIALFIATIAAFFVVLGWISSAVLNVVRFYGFSLREEDRIFTRTYGLFTKRVHALPRVRIQAVRLKQTLLRRLLGYGELRTDDMGAGAQDKTAEAQGIDVFVPMAKRPVLDALLPQVLSAADAGRYAFRRTSARIVRRSATRFALLGTAIAAGGFAMIGWWAVAIPFALAPLGILWGLATLRTLTWAYDPDLGLAVRRGVFRREHAFAPKTRLQALTLVQSPFDRWHGVATLTAIVGGGARVAIPNVPVEEAREASRALMG